MLLTLSFAGLALFAAQDAEPYFGQGGNLPIDISADGSCEFLDQQDRIKCVGDVRVTQGISILSADEMTVDGVSSDGGFNRIESRGNVRYADGENAVSGELAIYDASTSIITVTGNVIVIQGEQIMVGGELIYNTSTGAMSFTPGADGRVRGLFYTAPSGQ
ncbi:LptA/OstA family protein [Parvularcula sp. LCG005]|uniref:LptA/OstA family protein n=1 Tax=Parvularcula sp. LCG005 TaxID=3078805 RepID=UPI0029438002|nr:LptA/OstA family protein [Parvularcula sp. LCG005]WOI52899.1 LptA/OstA family protein [Parvularcula sp. LCG005]